MDWHLGEAAVRHLEDADLVGRPEAVFDRAQDAEVVARVALERHHRVDHVLDDARPGDLAVLGDVPHQNDGRAVGLGEADQRLRAAAHLRHGAGGRLDRFGPHGLDRVDDRQRRGQALGQGGDNVLDIGLGRKLHRRMAQAQPLGAQAHLRDRLLARDVGDAMPRGGQRRGSLHQQRRFADAGVAADQDHRAAHEAAARHTVELGEAGRGARGLVRLAGQPLQREYAALGAGRARRHGPRHWVRRAGLLDNGVPAAAGLALALPAIVDRAAALTDEGGVAFGHFYSMPAPRYVRA